MQKIKAYEVRRMFFESGSGKKQQSQRIRRGCRIAINERIKKVRSSHPLNNNLPTYQVVKG